jgi:hypothetical protein
MASFVEYQPAAEAPTRSGNPGPPNNNSVRVHGDKNASQFKSRVNSGCHAGLDPASSNVIYGESTGFPFELAQGGESFDYAQDREPVERPVEPRVKPGMTFGPKCEDLPIVRQSLKQKRQTGVRSRVLLPKKRTVVQNPGQVEKHDVMNGSWKNAYWRVEQ